ncbi:MULTISPECIES: restriction endonuclease subunit S [Klebsiella]|uniref:restriction endonuclease subunit S n=1 Tax=Klebsiella TaxID=570 RepID=UPI0006661198|nr:MULTISPECIES: restriction endonuclease subunit S [Klebsiella]MEC6166600.1 restriction endonuclease subunit S [Klebsiella grimontii]UHD01349.1 restriction endonuclease subunit S [Klebsiella pasteurii]
MGSKWKTSFLTDHYIISSGLSKPAKDFGTGYPFLSFKDIFYNYFLPDSLTQLVQSTDKERAACSVKRGDVFLTRTSETMHELGMSSVALKDYGDATFNGFCKRLRPKEESELEPEYVGYYLRSPLFRQNMLAFSTMSTRASLNNEMISRLEINYPGRKIQKKIAHILLSFDKKIAISKATNQTLEQMSQTLFKSWFVDFDPVIDNALDAGNSIPEALQSRAELRQKVRNSADFKPLPADLRALFPAEFEETELGWVPKGWILSDLGKEFNITMGQSPSGSTYNEDGIGLPFFQGKTDFGFRFPSKRIYCTEPKRLAKRFDTLLSVRAPVGVVNQASTECIIGRGLAALRHKSGNIAFTYYSVSNLSDYFSIFNGEGTVFGSINQKDLKQLPQICPPEKLINKFEEFSGKWETMISVHCNEIESLSNLRDTLLPKLISGELSLEDLPDLVTQTEPA